MFITLNNKRAVKKRKFFYSSFQGIEKNDEEQINRAKASRSLVFVCPKDYICTLIARFICSIKHKNLTDF